MGVFPGEEAEVRPGKLPIGLVHHQKPPHLPGPFRQGPKGLLREEGPRGGVGVGKEENPAPKGGEEGLEVQGEPFPEGHRPIGRPRHLGGVGVVGKGGGEVQDLLRRQAQGEDQEVGAGSKDDPLLGPVQKGGKPLPQAFRVDLRVAVPGNGPKASQGLLLELPGEVKGAFVLVQLHRGLLLLVGVRAKAPEVRFEGPHAPSIAVNSGHEPSPGLASPGGEGPGDGRNRPERWEARVGLLRRPASGREGRQGPPPPPGPGGLGAPRGPAPEGASPGGTPGAGGKGPLSGWALHPYPYPDAFPEGPSAEHYGPLQSEEAIGYAREILGFVRAQMA